MHIFHICKTWNNCVKENVIYLETIISFCGYLGPKNCLNLWLLCCKRVNIIVALKLQNITTLTWNESRFVHHGSIRYIYLGWFNKSGGILLSPVYMQEKWCQHNYIACNLFMSTCKIVVLTCDLNYFACQHNYVACWHKEVACENNYSMLT